MRIADRFLQSWRSRVAAPWVPAGARVLDIGCFRGEFLDFLGERIHDSIGIDPLAPEMATAYYRLVSEPFREPLPYPDGAFDAIVLLATMEHLDDKESIYRECRRLLPAGGRVILTVPAPAVDHLVDLLVRIRLADGMSLEQHHGFEPGVLPSEFARHGFGLLAWRRFQLGLNNLYVFERLG